MLIAIWLMIQFFAVGAIVWMGPQLSGDTGSAVLIALLGALALVPLAPAARSALGSALAALSVLAAGTGAPALRRPRPLVARAELPEAPGAPGSIRVRAPALARGA